MSCKGKTWAFTKDEQDFIVANYNTMSKKDIAKHLNVATYKVSAWAKYHGIAPKKAIFSSEDINFMAENYDKMSYVEIANVLGYTERQVRGKINNMGLTKVRQFDKHYFENIDSSNKAYWLGFIYADGYVISREGSNYELGIELNRNDEYHLKKFNDELGGVHKIYQKHKDLYIADNKEMSSVDSSLIRIYSADIVNDLQKHGIIQDKTNIADTYPEVEGVFFMDFLRGYIDGDGCIYVAKEFKKSQVHITSCYRNVLDYISKRLESEYGISSTVYKEKDRKHRLYISSKDVIKFLDLLYKDLNCTCLNRKYEKYLELKSQYYSHLCRKQQSNKLGKIGEGLAANSEVSA